MKGLSHHSRRTMVSRFRPNLESLEERLALSGFQMLLSQEGFAPLTIADNGPGDRSPEAGVITFIGSYGTFPVNMIGGVSTQGPAGEAQLHLVSLNVAGPQGGALRVLLSDDSYLPPAAAGQALQQLTGSGGTLTGAGSVGLRSYLADESGNQLAGLGPGQPSTPGAFSNSSQTTMNRPAAPYALVNEATIGVAPGGLVSFGLYSSLRALNPVEPPPVEIDPGLLIPEE